jgi:hypothetical protein
MLSDRDIERLKAERLDRQMDITVQILAVATMLTVAVATLGLLAPLGSRFLPK